MSLSSISAINILSAGGDLARLEYPIRGSVTAFSASFHATTVQACLSIVNICHRRTGRFIRIIIIGGVNLDSCNGNPRIYQPVW